MTNKSASSEPVAVVTGASRGIGAAIASELARRGHRLALLSRDREKLREVAQEVAGEAPAVEAFACDLQDPQQVEKTFEAILQWAGRIDVLINNAGLGIFAPLHQLSDTDWDSQLNTNLRGVFYCSRAVIPAMISQQSGAIINISSLAGKNAFADGTAYCASKWGLQGLTYCLAEELRQHNIRVSVICPGSVQTEFSPHKGKDPAKLLQPEDVAKTVGWLLEQSPQSFVSEISIRPAQKP